MKAIKNKIEDDYYYYEDDSYINLEDENEDFYIETDEDVIETVE